jgi:CopG family nickel-responsive transcriptional regulator
MSETVRFGVSLNSDLLDRFDALIRRMGYENRSEAIRDLIRDKLVHEEWEEPQEPCFGVVLLVYDHHTMNLDRRLIDTQHEHVGQIISSLHIHIDEDNCAEVVVLRGNGQEVRKIGERLMSMKGVKFSRLNMGTTGRHLH